MFEDDDPIEVFNQMSETAIDTITNLAEMYDDDSAESTLARSIVAGTRLQLEALRSVMLTKPEEGIETEIFAIFIGSIMDNTKYLNKLARRAKRR